MAEQNNELLMKNHELRPTGSTPFPEVNATRYNNYDRGRNRGRECSHGRQQFNYRNYNGLYS
jgi:hypothetical protein